MHQVLLQIAMSGVLLLLVAAWPWGGDSPRLALPPGGGPGLVPGAPQGHHAAAR